MSKKQFSPNDLVSFYHWSCEDKVHGLVQELYPNNLVGVLYNHPETGPQSLILHTSALQRIMFEDMVDLTPDQIEAVKQTVVRHDHALRMLSK